MAVPAAHSDQTAASDLFHFGSVSDSHLGLDQTSSAGWTDVISGDHASLGGLPAASTDWTHSIEGDHTATPASHPGAAPVADEHSAHPADTPSPHIDHGDKSHW